MGRPDLDLSSEEIKRLTGFLGYGCPTGVWFIGIEEGLGKADSDEARENLKARGSFKSVMDLREAHLLLRERGQPIDLNRMTPSTPVWQWMAKIKRAIDGSDDWMDLSSSKNYIKTLLGRSTGDTFLTELSPIPSGRATDKRWILSLEKLDGEIARKIKDRRIALKLLLKNSNPPLVICYGGISRADDFAELLSVQWKPLWPDLPKVLASSDMKCRLLPFFGTGHMSHSIVERIRTSGILER